METVILVEGESDKAALEALAPRGSATILVMNGATNIRQFLSDAVAKGITTAGLCDIGEEGHVTAALESAGLGEVGSRSDLERLGFFVCDPDLEGELIRAVGVDEVVSIIATEGNDLRRFRTLQHQPEWKGRPVEDQLRRWLGSGSGRKIRYASLLAQALEIDRAPRPIRAVLDYALKT